VNLARSPPVVLVLDDHALLLSALRRLVRGQPVRLVTAETTSEAFAVLDREAVAVVVSDYQLGSGDLDGLTFLRLVHAQRPNALLFLSTGTTAAPQAGLGIGVLPKPMVLEDLMRAVAGLEEAVPSP